MTNQMPTPDVDALTLVLEVWLKWFPLAQTKVPPLSHYTSAEGLLGICSSNSIWATCAQYSNDRSEGLYAQAVANEVLQEFFQSRSLEGGEFLRSFLEKHAGLVKGIEIADAYIASFCESSDLLSQWRAYGKTAGFEIRFDSLTKPLSLWAAEVPAVGSPAVDAVRLVRVEYDKSTQKEMLVRLLEGAYEVLKTVEAQNPERKYLDIGVAALAALELMVWLYGIKHPSFAEEKEWRIVGFPKRDYLYSTYKHPEELRFRAGRHSLVPYVELRPSEGRLPVNEVICGPGGHQTLTSKAVELLMAATGFTNVKVRNSAVPLAL